MIGPHETGSQAPHKTPAFNPAAIPTELDRGEVWVTWGGRTVNESTGELKLDKAPRSPRGTAVSSTAKGWFKLGACLAAVRKHPEQLFGVGRMLNAAEDGIVAVDLDHVLDHAEGIELVDELKRSMPHAYFERSPSGNGVRMFAWAPGAVAKCIEGGREFVQRAAWPVEGCQAEFYAYARGRRYVTVTGDVIHPGDLTVDSSAAVLALAERIKPQALAREPKGGNVTTPASDATDADVARAMLPLLGAHRAEDRSEWIRVMLALKAAGLGLDEFIEFSRRCPAKFDAADCEAKWKSAVPQRANVAWLVAMAGEDAGPEARRAALRELHARAPRGPGWKHAPADRSKLHAEARETDLADRRDAVEAERIVSEITCLREFVEEQRERWRWIGGREQWIEWRAGWWRIDVEGRFADLARTAVELHFPAPMHTLGRASTLVSNARDPMRIEAGKLDVAGDVIGVGPRGEERIVNLRTGETRQARPEDHVTRSTGIMPGGDAPTWRACLDRWTCGDAELVRYLQLVAGYWLTGSVALHEFYLLHGAGRDGKSTFVDLVAAAMGPYAGGVNVSALLASDREAHPTSKAKLAGLRLAHSGELPKGSEWNESAIKALTGGDRITARFVNQDEFDFDPTHKLVIHTNTLPRIREGGRAWERRMRVIPFRAQVSDAEDDRSLRGKLTAELPGILAWLIEGARQVLAITGQGKGLTVPEAVRRASGDYLADEDWFGQWLADRCDVDAGERWFTPARELIEDFDGWRESSGMPRHMALTPRQLMAELPKRGLKPEQLTTGSRPRGWRGIRLKAKFAGEIPI